MSVAVKLAKSSLILFSLFVFAIIGLAVYMYVNMNSLAKGFVEQTASEALGVTVTIGAMDIHLEELKVLARDVRIANPEGYDENAQAIHLGQITIAAQSFDKKHLKFTIIGVEDAAFNLDVRPQGTNLGDLIKSAQSKPQGTDAKSQAPNVSIQQVKLSGTQLTPSSTLIDAALKPITLEQITINNIGTDHENGIPAKDAIVIVTSALVSEIHKSANSAGMMEGVPLEIMNEMGVSTLDVFNKNLKNAYDNKVKAAGESIEKLKGIFSE